MARRRRRRTWRRVSPERGWLVGSDYTSITVTAPHAASGGFSQLGLMVQFDDIDPDEGTMVQHDKADWFMQRMLLNAWCYAVYPTAAANQARSVQLLVGTFRNETVLQLVDPLGPNPAEPLSPYVYDSTNRIIQTGVELCVATNSDPPRLALQLDNAGDQLTAEGSHSLSVAQSSEMARARFCFDVKAKVGLRPDQGLHLLVGGVVDNLRHPATTWQTDDVLVCEYTYQFLLQKRRG